MTHAPKSKQIKTKSTSSLTIKSKIKASRITLEKATTNSHRRNMKLWKEWEAINNFISSSESIIVRTTMISNSMRVVQDLQNLITRLRALDDYIMNKWKSLDNLLDNKIEHLIITLINHLQSLITNIVNSNITVSQ